MIVAIILGGLIGFIVLIAWWIYRAGAMTQSARNILEAINEKQKIEKRCRKLWLKDVDVLAGRKRAVYEWLRKTCNDNKI